MAVLFMRNVMNHAPTTGAWYKKNVKNQSQKRSLKMLQIERKTEIKRWFLSLRVVVFRFFRGQSIAFRL